MWTLPGCPSSPSTVAQLTSVCADAIYFQNLENTNPGICKLERETRTIETADLQGTTRRTGASKEQGGIVIASDNGKPLSTGSPVQVTDLI
jgi:hypothetical protein